MWWYRGAAGELGVAKHEELSRTVGCQRAGQQRGVTRGKSFGNTAEPEIPVRSLSALGDRLVCGEKPLASDA